MQSQVVMTGVREMLAYVNDLSINQLPFAVASALTNTVRTAAVDDGQQIIDAFANPTPFTRNAVSYTPANKVDLTASVFVKDIQAKYLDIEAEGGQRDFKTFEDRFAGVSGSEYIMPGKGVKLNQYGNISKAQIVKIAKDLNSSSKAKRFFSGKPKGGTNMPSGIYARVDNNTKLTALMVFATSAVYQKRFRFSEIANLSINANFETNMIAAWSNALQTMRL